jgi:hypothetical protein
MTINPPSRRAGKAGTPAESNGIPAHELPSAQFQGALEPVAFF